MPHLFSSDADIKLLKLVKENPVLYNVNNTKYSDCDTREATWQKIGDAMRKSAAEFAGIQCHIQFGDYNEEKHKPGLIENFNEYLPEQYCSSWGIEKKILKEYSKHVGLNELEAKHLYTKSARELPTYGVTFFLVKEKQKDKKKLVPRLLGINADAILRLDERTKEILQQWPLTQVKTYHAGKGETFTLDFGDYSDKEYSVKTRDAFRIRDILEGYIDLIRKRMLANYNKANTEHSYMAVDNVTSGTSSTIQHISNNPSKIIEHTFVGPSKIVQYEAGQHAQQGTQIVTMQQIITSDMANRQGQGIKGEVPMRKDMSMPFTRRLNRLNSSSVKIVSLLTEEPSQAQISDAQKIVTDMNGHMPYIRDGVKETVEKQTTAEERKKLEDQLRSLEELIQSLNGNMRPGDLDTTEANDTAKEIADLTTQMYFAMDPSNVRRSKVIRRSRGSFIEDEKTEQSMRRASFIAATGLANHALDNAVEALTLKYSGPLLDPRQVQELERSAVDKLGKIDAAIAHYLLAHEDPKNVDYAAAVTSLNTIHELMPELAKDGQVLATVKDGKDRKELLDDIKKLCEAAKYVCSLSGVEDPEKLQEASAKYANVAGKLIYTFGKSRASVDKENEIIGLAKEVGVETSRLLTSARALTELAAAEPAAHALDHAGVQTATAAKHLIAQAELNAPTISEPHCQSALTAASQALSGAAQRLANAWKPLVEPPARHDIKEKLHNGTMDLAKALDRLNRAYTDLGVDKDVSEPPNSTEAQRLKFINSLSKIGANMQDAEEELNKPLELQVKDAEAAQAQARLIQRLGQLNAAIAGLLAATSDRGNPDYGTAELAVAAINELMPDIVKDSKTATANQDEASRAALLDNVRALCGLSQSVCASAYGANPEDLNETIAKYTDASGKLTYVVNKRANPHRESRIIDESSAACNQAGVLLSGVQQLAEVLGDERGAELDAKGAELADAAQSLLTTAQVTSQSISEPRCQAGMLGAVDKAAAAARRLAAACQPLAAQPAHAPRVRALHAAHRLLEDQLDKLRDTCLVPDIEVQEIQSSELQGAPQELKYIYTLKGAEKKLADAQKELNKPVMPAKGSDVGAVQDRLSQRLGQLNAAIAALLAATADRNNPDYKAAEEAANTIAELMPQVIKDTKTVGAGKDEPTRAAVLTNLQELSKACEEICASADGNHPEALKDAVAKFNNVNGKLVYVVCPRANLQKGTEIEALSTDAYNKASQLLPAVRTVAADVGGVQGRELDARAAALNQTAHELVQTAKITAPSISSPPCQKALLSSVEGLSDASQQLAASIAPIQDAKNFKHSEEANTALKALQQLDGKLDEIRKACASSAPSKSPAQSQKKLQFVKTMQGAKEKLEKAEKELNKPVVPMKGADMGAVQDRLSQKLGQLNAAIASLINATADRENPDCLAAEHAANSIAELMPQVIQDTRTVSAGKDEATRAAMLANIKDLCKATEGICASPYGDPQAFNDDVAKLTNASGKLVYVVSPRKNPQIEEQIMDGTTGACNQTSALLAGVSQLAADVGGDLGQDLDVQGSRVADAANGLLQTAQLTAPSISSPDCQKALSSSVEQLSSAAAALAATVAPLQDQPQHNKRARNALQALQQLEAQLEALRKACKVPAAEESQVQEKQKLHFDKTMQGAKEKLEKAEKELNKPVMPAKGSDVGAVQDRLSHRLGQLNAAIAALINATSDRENPDYLAAEHAANSIAELMPQVIQDTKTVSAGKDEATCAAMLAQVKDLCKATEGICASPYGDPQAFNDDVAKLTNASGKLVYVVSPRKNPQVEDQIIELTSGACNQTSGLLSGVAQLAAEVGGEAGQELDTQGGRVVDAANSLLQTAQLTAPSISSPDCQKALSSSVDQLSSAAAALAATVAPLQDQPQHNKRARNALQALQQLEAQLEALRKACKAPATAEMQAQKEHKVQFDKAMQGTKEKLERAEKELNKPLVPGKGANIAKVQDRLSQRLGQLNAAIAALVNATTDRENPDYLEAEHAANSIAELMPQVIQDTRTVSAGKDEATRAAMLAQVKDLCKATEGICASPYGDPQAFNDEVAMLTNASGKLVYVVSPKKNPQIQEQIVDLTTGACNETSALLSGVAQLAAEVGGEAGQALDAQGGRVADAANSLLQSAQLTAPSISSPDCQKALSSSVEQLSSAAAALAATVTPLQDQPQHNKRARDALQALQQLEAQLETLRKACKAPAAEEAQVKEQQKLQFVNTMQGTKQTLEKAEKELNKPAIPAKGADVDKVQDRLSQRLGLLNAAIAALVNATADRENPDYLAAERAANSIAELMPQVIQDTRTVSAGKDEATRAAMLAQVKELCKATEGICASPYGDPQALNNDVAKLTNASGKLVYVVSPKKNPQIQEQIVELARVAREHTSALVSGVGVLAAAAPPAHALHARAARTAAAADTLRHTAQITGPSISSPHCQKALLSSVDNLSYAAEELAASVTPLQDDAKHNRQAGAALKSLQQLEDHLETIREACKAPAAAELEVQKQEKLQFVKTMQGTTEKLKLAEKELSKPVAPAKGSDMKAVQDRLSQRLGQLNGAIAALINATTDRERPDYPAAERSANSIAELMPQVIKDTRTVSAGKDEATRAAMLANIKDLCKAAEGICANPCGDPQAFNDDVAKYTAASGQLGAVISPRNNAQTEDRIMELTAGACSQTSGLLSGVAQLAADVAGDAGLALDARGTRLADAANGLLQSAQITAPSISSLHCKKALVCSVDDLSFAAQELSASLAPLQDGPPHEQRARAALLALQQLEAQLEELRKACSDPETGEAQNSCPKQQFLDTIQDAKIKLGDTQKELHKPAMPAKGSDVNTVQDRLSQRLGQLNAAIAALINATANRDKPDYKGAQQAANTITELMPQVIKDTKTVSSVKDEPTRDAMIAHLKELCKAAESICGSSDGSNPQAFNDAVAKITNSSGKLLYVVSPKTNPQKEQQIIELTGAACNQTSGLLAALAQLAVDAGGEGGHALGARGGRLADLANVLLQNAQITASSISTPQCKEALLTSIDQLSTSSEQLAASLAPLQNDPKHKHQASKLAQALQQLGSQLDSLRKACLSDGPTVMQKPTGHPTRRKSNATQDFLDRLRCEESIANSSKQPASIKGKTDGCARKTDDEKRLYQLFVASIDEVDGSFKQHESSLMKLCRATSGSGAALSQADMTKKQEQLQRNLALAGVEVANLVSANYADNIDFTAASRSTKALPQLMTSIVEDGKQLSDNVNDMARKAFLYDMLQLCGASRKICDAAKNDRQKLNESAVHFGDMSAKLLYVVSNDVDPALEKEIITRAKAIGDSASRLASDAAGIATAGAGTAGSSVQDICDAGTACVDAAGKLVYTAKLTAPTIHEVPCQTALVTSTETLSTKLKAFSDSWKPLANDSHQAKTIKELTKEAENLERILEGLRSDVRGGHIGRRREMEHLVVENSPLRLLSARILDDAKLYAESPALAAPHKIAYAAFADKLTLALRALDLAHARCKKAPHDTNKLRELENAIQNLQMIVLQERPSRGDKGKSNIVDLRDFIDEVSAEAKTMQEAARDARPPAAQDRLVLEEIKEKCNAIENKAHKLMNVDSRSHLDSSFDDILGVDQFGHECEALIKQINDEIKGMEDLQTKRLLHSKALALSEGCNLLRFATKSGISTAACAGLESSLESLDAIEARALAALVRDAAAAGVVVRSKQPLAGNSAASIKLCREVAATSGVQASTVTAYIADAASRTDTNNPEEKNKLLKHLYKLVHLLKTLTVTSSQRTATWQTLDGPDVATVTEQILKEIHNPESKFGIKPGDEKNQILNEADIAKLLIPSAPKILGDQKQQEDKLVAVSCKLSSMCGALTLAVSAPAALARSAHAAADAALELDAIARGCRAKNSMQHKRIDEAAKEMSFATYAVLKSAESASQDPNNPNLRRRLVDASKQLNQAINKLVSASSSAPALHRQCSALSRNAALQLASLAPAPLTAAAFSETADKLHSQKDNIYKLKSDEAIDRKEFMKGLDDLGASVRISAECASQCAYFIAVSEQNKDIAKAGLVDVPQIQKSIEAIQDSCLAIIGSNNIHQASEEKEDLRKRVEDLSGALDKAQVMISSGDVKKTLVRARSYVTEAAEDLQKDLTDHGDMSKITPKAVTLLEAVNQAHGLIEQCPLVPRVGNMSPDTKARCDEVMNQSKSLLSNALALLKDVNCAPADNETMTWVSFNTSRKKLLDAYDALVKSVKKNGHSAGIYDKAPEEEEVKVKKSYIEIQVDLANKWLKSPVAKVEVKAIGQQAVRNVVDMARQMSEDLKGSEREELRNAITETEQLLNECNKKYDHEKNSVLMDRIKELKKSIQRGVVTRVVEDFIEAEAPLADLDTLADVEKDESKRKFLLERKIASLLAQLGRVTKTARFVAGGSQHLAVELTHCSEQTELLAPMLVKAAQQRIDHPDDKTIIENYKSLLAQYAESISKVRDLCDRAVDPMDFVQTAGDTMQRMREDMTQHNNDPQKCAYSSSAITKLANRVIHVSMSSNAVQSDPELQKALIEAKKRLHAVTPAPDTRASRLPDWRESTAEILRTTGDVESALGGENIFKKKPTTANQPIYSVARDLHESVREWSSRDNEIVAVARRVAVLMARLSEHMETDRKDALIATSKSIVVESQEVAELAKKLAHECSDVRIKTNLLQTCERIPTISGQLKMLTTVKGSSLGHQGSEEDKEAMDMLVGNAQSLMLSIQEVVKAAAGASVKIMSQRGPRLRWVRKNYY